MKTAKNKTLELTAYTEAEAWERVTETLLDAKRDLNYSTLLRASFAVEHDDIEAQIEEARQVRDDYKDGVENLTLAITAYKMAYRAGYAEQYIRVLNEEWIESHAAKAGA
jgi:hypothetical protein